MENPHMDSDKPVLGRTPQTSDPASTQVEYSLVIPVYRNEANIPSLLTALAALGDQVNAASAGGDSNSSKNPAAFEVVFVVDGSPDNSYAILFQKLTTFAHPTQLLSLSRNFGSFAAIKAGMAAARGRYIAVMAADLQEPPELVLGFFKQLRADGCDISVGKRVGRADPLFSKFSSQSFWWFYRRVIQPAMPEGGIDAFGCNEKVRDHIVRMNESHSSLVGQLIWLGFRRSEVPYERRAGNRGVGLDVS